MRHSIVYLAMAIFLLGRALPASGDQYDWIAPGGGLFSNPSNWSGPVVDVPDSDDEAYFFVGGSYQVTFDDDVNNQALFVFDDWVDFDLGTGSVAPLHSGQGNSLSSPTGERSSGMSNTLPQPEHFTLMLYLLVNQSPLQLVS